PAGLVGHERPTGRTRLGSGSLPDRELALGVPVAAVERLPPAGSLHHQLTFAALRARDAGSLLLLLDVAALRVPAASGERAEPADAFDERLPTFRTGLPGLHRLGPLLPGHVPRVGALRVVL